MTTTNEEKPADPFKLTDEQIISGIALPLKSRSGKEIIIRVLECPCTKYQDYFQAVGFKNLALELRLTTDAGVGLLDQLTQKDALALQTLSRKVNLDFFEKAVSELNPVTATRLDRAIADLEKLENGLTAELSRHGLDTSTFGLEKPGLHSAKSNASEPAG